MAVIIVASVSTTGVPAVVGSASAQQGGEVTEINACTTISEPGQYVLTEDIEDTEDNESGACIGIESNDVVFDGNGHTIAGGGNNAVGIGLSSGNNVTIQNTILTDSGIFAQDATDLTIADNTVRNSPDSGISLFIVSSSEISNNTVTESNQAGIKMVDGRLNRFENNTVTDNDGAGISFDGAIRNSLINTVATGNSVGISFSSAGNTTIETADLRNNTDRAFESSRAITSPGGEPEETRAKNVTLDSARISFTATKVDIESVDDPLDDPDNRQNIGSYVDVTKNQGPVTEFQLDVHYTDEDLQDANVDEESLRMYRYNESTNEWSEASRSSVDTDENVVSANFTVPPGERSDEPSSNPVTFIAAPLGQVADDDGDSDADDEKKRKDDQGDNQRDENAGDDANGGGADDQQEKSGQKGSDNGQDDGKQGGDKAPTAGDGDEVFSEPVVLQFAGSTFLIGPPTDPDGDGVYEDVTGNGELTVVDAVSHAIVVASVQEETITLTDDQAAAVDINGDGTVTFEDAYELLTTALDKHEATAT
jgi:parallel beta-helix repeat protein